MTVVAGGSKCNLITGYTEGEDNQILYGKHKWLAQTFTLDDLYVIFRCRCKSWTILGDLFYHYALRNTDGLGKPTGADLAHTTLSPMGEYWYSPGKWRVFDFMDFPNLPAGLYALVFSVPDSGWTNRHKLRCDATAPLYPLGKAWESNDSGTTWVEIPNTDFIFEVWGWPPPPTANPTPVISNWAPLTIADTGIPTGFEIVVTTDIPVHLFMRWTDKLPLKHPLTEYRRGILIQTGTRYCFVTWKENEQEEAGDTLTHTFIKKNWPVCQTRYFYFIGTKQTEEQPSASPIFKLHRTEYVPTQFFFPFEPDLLYISASDAWVKVDRVTGGLLKDLLPLEATVAFIHAVNRGAALRIGLRPTGSTHTIIDFQLEDSHTWAHVALDGNNEFEAYVDLPVNQDLYLMGYAIDPAVVMLANPIPKTLAANWAWQTFDLSDICPDAIAILCEAEVNIIGEIAGFRKHDSTDDRRATLMHNWIVIGCSDAQKIDVISYPWGGWPGKFYVTGYIKQSATFETNGIDQSLGTITSYQPIVVPQSCNLAFYEEFSPAVAAKLAMRPFGSAEDIFEQPNYRHIWIVGAPNADLKLEGKIESLNTDWFYIGSGT